MEWAGQQDQALVAVGNWLRDKNAPQLFRLFGFAGTGKTTLAKEIARMAKGHVLFGSFTGKAALVLRKKSCGDARTIHSMIYKAEEDLTTGVVSYRLNPDSPVASAGLVIIDECSMVGHELGNDLLSFGKKVLVLGDPAQLPPVNGAGFFTDHEPDVMLTDIHRQAAGNPIIMLATKVRNQEQLQIGQHGDSRVIARASLGQQTVLGSDQVIVGRNLTRRGTNAKIRALKNRVDPMPVVGDRLVCLKNNKDRGLLNGSLWDVVEVFASENPRIVRLKVKDADGSPIAVEVAVPVNFFLGTEADLEPKFRRLYQEFDYGYALTCHKSQGSQWDSVVIFDESSAFREDRHRWLYTAITRAAERMVVAV